MIISFHLHCSLTTACVVLRLTGRHNDLTLTVVVLTATSDAQIHRQTADHTTADAASGDCNDHPDCNAGRGLHQAAKHV